MIQQENWDFYGDDEQSDEESKEEMEQRLKYDSLQLSKFKDLPFEETYLRLKEDYILLKQKEKKDPIFKAKSKLRRSILKQSNIQKSKIYKKQNPEEQVSGLLQYYNQRCIHEVENDEDLDAILEKTLQIQNDPEKQKDFLNEVKEIESLSQNFYMDLDKVQERYIKFCRLNLEKLKLILLEEYYENPFNEEKQILDLSKICKSSVDKQFRFQDLEQNLNQQKFDQLEIILERKEPDISDYNIEQKKEVLQNQSQVDLKLELEQDEDNKIKAEIKQENLIEKEIQEQEIKIVDIKGLSLEQIEKILGSADDYLLNLFLGNEDLQKQFRQLEEQIENEEKRKKEQLEEEEISKIQLIESQNFEQLEALRNLYGIEVPVINQLHTLVGQDETEKLLKVAIEVCHGDKKQAVNILIANPLELIEYEKLDPIQKSVMQQVGLNSIRAHQDVQDKLIERFIKMKFKKQDLDRVLQFIRDEAQIIVHFKLHEIIQFLGKTSSKNLKNLFEINKSNGYNNKEARKSWEKNIFSGKYDQYQQEDDKKRPKYGVFNIFNNPQGVKNCQQYGKSYFVLKNTRLRTTFTYQDTSFFPKDQDNYQFVSTCQYYGYNLNQFSDKEIQNLISSSQQTLKNQQKIFPEQEQNYKEIQIHGDIFFDQHIEEIHYSNHELNQNVNFSAEKLNKLNKHSPVQKTNKQYLEKFLKKFKTIKAIPIDDQIKNNDQKKNELKKKFFFF